MQPDNTFDLLLAPTSYLMLVSILNVAVGLVAIVRQPNKIVNRVFSLLCLSIALWAAGIAGFLLSDENRALVWAKLYYCAPILSAIATVILAQVFPDYPKIVNKLRTKLAVGFGVVLIFALIFIPNFLTAQVIVNELGVNEVILNKLHYSLYTLYFLYFFYVSLYHLYRRRAKERGQTRQQTSYFLIGLSISSYFGVFFNLLLPWVNNYRLIWAGPLFSTCFAVFIAVSILRHRLFDIRAIFARTVAYLFTVALGVGFYAALLFGAGTVFVQLDNISARQWAVIGTLALVLAVSYSQMVALFNRITNRLFYRDAYDTKKVLEKVSGIIVGNIDPHRVQKGALGALSEAVRPTYAAFLLAGGNGTLQKGDVIGEQWSVHDPGELQAALRRVGKKITVYDELEEGGGKLRDVLRKEDISVVAPLVTKDETIGYLVLGAKKSGNIYNSQDVGLLNIATNELAVALQNAQRFEEIQAFNITLQEKVTEATRELKKTNKKLIALDEAKDEFISMASHQLRTPLTSIKGYLSMLIEGDLGKVTTTQEKALQDAFGSSQRMVYLIADFLNVSRIKTGKFVIDPSEVELPQIVNEEISQLREMAAAKDLKLTYEQPGIFPTVRLDENKIRQVMMNMVDNAIYYTPSGGKITIQLYVTGDDLFFKVVDTGIGVPKREQHKMFTKFFRADNAKKARPDGTGLGLFMAQKIIVEQGGAVIFESVEGKGSTFGFRFPLAKIKS